MLEHKNGGKITAIVAIGHETHKRVASWHYVGRVEWCDGTVSERTNIAPYAVCFDSADTEAKAQFAHLCEQLNMYLQAEGEWLTKPRHINGCIVHWIPKAANYEVAV